MKIAALLSACIFIGGGAVSFATNNSEADTQPTTIKEMKNAPESNQRRTRTAGRSEDPNTGMAAPYSDYRSGLHRNNTNDNLKDNSSWQERENNNFNSKNTELGKDNTYDSSNYKDNDSINNNVSGVTGATTESDSSAKADNQNKNSKDLEITRQIRRGLMDQKDLSVRAHNLTVVTENGLVTLSGTVPLAAEKVSAGRIAQGVSGVSSVNNLIQVSK